jgi:hypothetical protein
MDLVEVGWGGVDWIGLAQDRDRCLMLLWHLMLYFSRQKLQL